MPRRWRLLQASAEHLGILIPFELLGLGFRGLGFRVLGFRVTRFFLVVEPSKIVFLV